MRRSRVVGESFGNARQLVQYLNENRIYRDQIVHIISESNQIILIYEIKGDGEG